MAVVQFTEVLSNSQALFAVKLRRLEDGNQSAVTEGFRSFDDVVWERS